MGSFECLERPGSTTSALLLHPHPDMGGNRHHPLIDALYRGLPITTCRFDFTSSATGSAHEEVATALERAPSQGVVLIGYSFGADIALSTIDPRVLGWFLIAPPLRVIDPAAMGAATDPRPKHLAVPEFDQFCPPDRAAREIAGWTATTMAPIAHSDHFLAGRSETVVEAAGAWLPSVVAGL